jgi:hypothetical protein
LLIALDALVDLFAVDGNAFWGVDSDAHLVSLHPEDGGRHIVPDHHRLTYPTSQYEHVSPKCSACAKKPT